MPYKDKEKQREAQRQHYLANKSKYADCQKENRDKRDIWFRDFKATLKCFECGFSDQRCLDFHHKIQTTKEFGISDGVKQGFSQKRIIEEIEKCEVLCANCHLIHHYKPKEIYHRNNVTNNMSWLKQYKENLCCVDCKIRNFVVLAFHHLDGIDKKNTISKMASNGYSVSSLIEEIEKCEVLCCNCHRIRHNGNVWEIDSNC